jgi:hypothetical protein
MLRIRSSLMTLALQTVRKTIPTTTSGAFDIPCEATFATKVNKDAQGKFRVDVAIKEFKLDQVGDEQPIDIVQVGARDVEIKTGSNDKTVKFFIRCNLKNAAKYTGEVSALVIADVA